MLGLRNKAPGVSFQWQSRIAKPQGRRTDIVGFVGIAERGPLHVPMKVENWSTFVSIFGGHIPQGYLAYSVQGFFANGGRTCWVVRIDNPVEAKKATALMNVTVKNSPREKEHHVGKIEIRATSAGIWGNRLFVRAIKAFPDFIQLYIDDGFGRLEQHQLTFRKVKSREGGNSESQQKKLSVEREEGVSPLFMEDVFCQKPLHVAALTDRKTEDHFTEDQKKDQREFLRLVNIIPKIGEIRGTDQININFGNERLFLTGGRDGLDEIQDIHIIPESTKNIPSYGLQALEPLDEISVVAIPDIMPPPDLSKKTDDIHRKCEEIQKTPDLKVDVKRVQRDLTPRPFPSFLARGTIEDSRKKILELQKTLIKKCHARRDRFAIIDPPLDATAILQIQKQKHELYPNEGQAGSQAGAYAALYFPALLVPDPLQIQGPLRTIPPSGHIAGIYAKTDNEIGVFKAPANEEFALVSGVVSDVDEPTHGLLNEKGINVIRSFPGRGIRVSGARTLVEDDLSLRYINVRRVIMMIEKAIETTVQWTVFEPNSPLLWSDIERSIRQMLKSLWEQGVFDGATERQAFSVRCDHTTNPPEQIDNGRVHCWVEVNPPTPAEFIQIRLVITKTGIEFER